MRWNSFTNTAMRRQAQLREEFTWNCWSCFDQSTFLPSRRAGAPAFAWTRTTTDTRHVVATASSDAPINEWRIERPATPSLGRLLEELLNLRGSVPLRDLRTGYSTF